MGEKLFELLLKFKSIRYEEGRIVLQAGNAALPVIGFVLLLLIGIIGIYYFARIYVSNRSRAISLGLRILALLLLCIPFLEPTLMYPDVIPNENFLAVLIDTSASMSIADGRSGLTREEDAAAILLDDRNGILSELQKNFNVRLYTFSNEASRVDSVANLMPYGRETNLTVSLERVMSDFKNLPLAGILLFTDGGDNSRDDVRSTAEELRGMGIPLHIVGLGDEALEQEREILSVTANAELAEGTGAEIDVQAKSWMNERRPVTVTLYRGSDPVLSKEVTLRGDGDTDRFTLYYWPEEKDVAEYTVQLAAAPGEVNVENNSLDLLIDASKDSVRVLYLEGYLRTDFKFIKRALEDDPILEFSSATRTGTGKYYRQGIYTVDELRGGFPATAEDLYRYRAVILGDIEASYFSMDQLAMIERFVSKRGGGFLMLGGLHSFSEGDYQNTPIANLLPVELDPQRRSAFPPDFTNPGLPPEEQGFKFVPTRAGLEYPILKLSEDTTINRMLWGEVPNLFSINYLGAVKPGATVLAEKPDDIWGDAEPLLVVQRYGRGRTAAFATASSWRWQMLLDANDTRHERFWRQVARWLSTDVPDNVNIELTETSFEPGTDLPVRVSVYDDAYDPVMVADVTGVFTDPYGDIHTVQFFPDVSEDGAYVSSFTLQYPGVYSLEVSAERNDELIGKQSRSVLSVPSKKEFYDAVLRKDFLENLADLSGGYYYEPSGTDVIPANMTGRESTTSVYRYEYVWDAPWLFLLAVMVLSVEWVYRRNRGLP